MGEGCVKLRQVDLSLHEARLLGSKFGGRRCREVALAECVRFGPMIDTANPCRPLHELPRPVFDGKHDGRGRIGKWGTEAFAQRRADVGLFEHLVHAEVALDVRVWIVDRVHSTASYDLCKVALGRLARVDHRLRLERGGADRIDLEKKKDPKGQSPVCDLEVSEMKLRALVEEPVQ